MPTRCGGNGSEVCAPHRFTGRQTPPKKKGFEGPVQRRRAYQPLSDIIKTGGNNLRVGILSDVHGNGVALDSIVSDMEKQKVEGILFLGDLVAKGPEPDRAFQILESIKPLCWIKGNTDMWFENFTEEFKPSTSKESYLFDLYKYVKGRISDERVSFLVALPTRCSIKINNISVLCVHGSPRSVVEIMDGSTPKDELKKITEGVGEDIIVCGHSHVPFIGESNGKKVINVGSVGSPCDGDNRASYGILFVSNNQVDVEIRRVEYDIKKLLGIAKKSGFPFISRYKRSVRKGMKD